MKVVLILAGFVAILGLLWLLLKRRQGRAGQSLTALVFLLKQPNPLTEPQVREAISKVWGVELGSEMQQGGDWLVEGGKVNPAMAQPDAKNYLVSANGRMFLINTVSRPYMDDPEKFAETIADMRLRRAVGSHRAWNSVDLFGEPPAKSEKPEIYAALGNLLAEFTHDDCVAIYCPELERCNEYAPQVIEALKSGQPLALFDEPTFAPIIQVNADDPRMVAAVEESRRRWPEFLAAFRARKSADHVFAIKARFAEGEEEEFMWVSVQKIEDTSITGRLENSPAALKWFKEGDTVTVQLADLNDWIYAADGQSIGGFTLKVMEQAMTK
jgi:uncharacterized protein YegJ (DUF2314 family)